MASFLKTRVAPAQVAEILGAIAVVLWRILSSPAQGLWRDWATLLAVYWFLIVALRGTKAAGALTAAAGAILMGLYLWDHAPHAVAFLRTIP